MKKILITIMSIIGIASINLIKVDAAEYKYHGYIYEGDKIDNIYYKNKDNSLREAHFYKVSESDKIIYSIEYNGVVHGAGYNDYDDTLDYRLTNLTQEQTKKMNLIGYYGYNYKDEKYDHTDEKWYAITQYLIWQVEANNSLDSIVDIDGKSIFLEEIKEMEKILDEHFIKPEFGSNSFKLKSYDELTIEDKNHVLPLFEAKESFGLDYQVTGDKITATSPKNENFILYLTKKDKRYSFSSSFYISENYQNAMSIGKLDDVTSYVKFNFVSGKVFINKTGEQLVDYQDGQFVYKTLQAKGTVYHLYAKNDIINNAGKVLYKKDELVRDITIGEQNSFDNLYLSDYYAKEISNPYAYHITGSPYNISLSFSNTTQSVSFKSNYQQAKIRFATLKQNASFINNQVRYDLVPHSNLKFGLFSADDIYSDTDSTTPIVSKDTLLATAESDASGTVNFNNNIPLGNYYITRINDDNNYYPKEERMEFSFKLDSSVSIQYINLKNYYSMLKVQKIIFKGNNDLKIYDKEKNIIIDEEISNEYAISLPFGEYFYSSNSGEEYDLTVNSTEELTINLEENKEQNGLVKPPVILIPNGGNTSNKEDKNENITQNLYKPIEPNIEKEETKEESEDKTVEKEENTSDEKDETSSEEKEEEKLPEEPKKDIDKEETKEESEDKTVEKEENTSDEKDETSSEEKEEEKLPEEPKKDIDKEETKEESKEIPVEKEENIPDEKDETSSEEKEEVKLPEEPKEDIDKENSKEESEEIPVEKEENTTDKKEEIPSEKEDNQNQQGESVKNDETNIEEVPNEKEDTENLPKNPTIEDSSSKEEATPSQDAYPEEKEDNDPKNENTNDDLNGENSPILNNSNELDEVEVKKEDIKLEEIDKENKTSNENLSFISTSNKNYEEINVAVPATDKYDISIILYIAIILISSITYIYVKE